MYEPLVTVLLWLSALGCGLMAGLYFAFSTFIMRAFGRIEQGAGIAAMNAINVDIQRSLFMPVFLGSCLIAAILAALALLCPMAPYASPMLIGSLVYLVGMFGVTVVRNVPLNNVLEAVDPSTEAARALWSRYLTTWTRWNHVRTLSSLVGCALHICAISLL